MLFKSALVTQVSGSIGGMTGSHNAGGMYFRARAIPVNPATAPQVAVRNLVAGLANQWGTGLTQAQRDAWTVYATNVPLINPLGDQIFVTGLNMYTRGNVARQQGTLARVDTAPTLFNTGDFTNPSVAFDATADEVDVTFTNTDAWANEDLAAMLVYASRPQSPTINFFKGPYQFAGEILGNSTTAPTSPAALAAPFVAVAGQKIFIRIVVVRADGRTSFAFRGVAIAA